MLLIFSRRFFWAWYDKKEKHTRSMCTNRQKRIENENVKEYGPTIWSDKCVIRMQNGKMNAYFKEMFGGRLEKVVL